MVSRRMGIVPRIRARLFGERDAVDAQLADLARQGAGMARVAHACAMAMIVLFSLGSLVTLSGDAVAAIVAGWQHGGAVNVPQAISVGVSGVLVLCLDTGMLLAAATLRVLRARRAPWGERWVHVAILCGVAAVEASTYALMSVTYDQPHNAATWAIILARSLSAPILSAYLALAQPLPVGPRDILAQVELASGAAVLRDVVAIAHDGGATLERKVRLYDASAEAPEGERARLARLIAVAAAPDVPPAGAITLPTLASALPALPTRVLAGAGVPMLASPSVDTPTLPAAPTAPTQARDVRPDGRPDAPPDRGPTGPGSPARSKRKVQTRRKKRTAPAVLRLAREPAEDRVRAALAATPGASVKQIASAAGVSSATASKWLRVIHAEQDREGARDAVAQ